MPIAPNMDQVIKEPNQAAFQRQQKQTRTSDALSFSTDINDSILGDIASARAQRDYMAALEGTNQQRSAEAKYYAAAEAALEERNQNLDYGAATKGYVNQGPIMEQAGVAGDNSRFDAAALDELIAKAAKDRATAANSGRAAKQPKAVYDPISGTTKFEVPLTHDQLPDNVRQSINDGTDATGGLLRRNVTNNHAPTPEAVQAPAAVSINGKQLPLKNAQPRPDGNFSARFRNPKTGQPYTLVVDKNGNPVSTEH